MLDEKKRDGSIKVTPLVLKMESDRLSPASAFASIQTGESNDWSSVCYLDGVIPLDNHGGGGGGVFYEVDDCCFGARLCKDWAIFCPAVVLVIGLKLIFPEGSGVCWIVPRHLVLKERYFWNIYNQ